MTLSDDKLGIALEAIEKNKLVLFYDDDGWNVHDPASGEFWCQGEPSVKEALRGIYEVATRQPNVPRRVK